jgi:hypothetical protein
MLFFILPPENRRLHLQWFLIFVIPIFMIVLSVKINKYFDILLYVWCVARSNILDFTTQRNIIDLYK